MRYRHSQVLELTGVSKDTIRYWKRHLAPLRQKDGRSQSYTFAEVVAIAAIAEAVTTFDLGVERLAPIADLLFTQVAKATEPGRDAGNLLIGPKIVAWADRVPSSVATCVLVVPLGPVISRIRASIAENELPNILPTQYELPIPGRRIVGLSRNRVRN